MNSETTRDPLRDARNFLSEASEWVRKNPSEAALLGVAGGFVVGLTGVGRIVRLARTLRGMPIVSDLVLGVVTSGILTRGFSHREEEVLH